MRERLTSGPGEILVTEILKPFLADDSRRSFSNMLRINFAHAVMLEERGIIDRSTARSLAEAIEGIRREGPQALDMDPSLEDLYFNIEKVIIRKTGQDIGGKLHTGRSRNDIGATLTRMNVRDEVLGLYPLFLDLRESILDLAARHDRTVMTGYTHLQPAQPMTFGFYLAGVASALERDFDRFDAAWARLNLSPLGSGAFNGTSFPIDRESPAALLGFDGVEVSAIDAIASRDYLLEILAALAILGATLGRFTNDLYLWATDEFRYIEVDDAFAVCSSIMPQKKNPITLEHARGKTAHLQAAFIDAAAVMRGTCFSHNRESSTEVLRPFWDALSQAKSVMRLLGGTIATMRVRDDIMGARANINFSTVTDLADELVKHEGMPFRVAHTIVGHAVRECYEKNLAADGLTPEVLNHASMECTGRRLAMPEAALAAILEAPRCAFGKTSQGASAPEEVRSVIGARSERLARDRQDLELKIARQAESAAREAGAMRRLGAEGAT